MSPVNLCRILLVFCLVTPACIKVGPDFTKPQATIAKDWLDAGDRRVKTESPEYRNWWKAFGDPTLDRLIETAYRENLNLRIAGVRVLEARAQLGVAIGEWFPQTQQAFGSLEKIRGSDHSPEAAVGRNLKYFQSEMGFRATWELDFWGKFRRAIESADASLLANIADYDNTLVSLTGDVAGSYISIRTLEKRLEIARQNVETQRESLKIATVKFQGGTTTQRDVEQAKTLLFNTEASIPSLEIQLRQAQNALCVLLGMPPSRLADLLETPGVIPAPPPQVAVGIPADLLRRRPDIRSAEAQAAAQCAQIGVAKAELFPAFSLSGTFSFLASDVGRFALGDMFQWRSRNASGGPGFQWNILNYGRLTNQVRVQDARFQELVITYQNAVLKAQQEVEDALVAFLRSQLRAKLLAESTDAARRSLGLAVLQYREGVTDFTTVLTAQQALLNEQDSLASTLGDISRNLVGVYRALGGGWQLREGQDFVPQEVQAEMAKRTNWGALLTPAAYAASVSASNLGEREPGTGSAPSSPKKD
ncbi:MAG: transporter [Deltaproteobacteria bacterium RBG_13_60_28]|nr:MAG: transporter [Deltaproteobacteria bacterium RBG_13_60_28]